MPNAVYEPERCLETTLRVVSELGINPFDVIFEVVESEQIRDTTKLKDILSTYSKHGFLTALDDFGAGSSSLNTLADFQPDIIKLDIHLVRNIHNEFVKQKILDAIMTLSESLNITLLAEGVETREEMKYLGDLGIHLMQGFYFHKPQFESLVDNRDIAYE